MGPFQVTKEMVGNLSSGLLRTLLEKLVEAEAKQWNISSACISVGGNDSAPDGGVDASIAWTGRPAARGWLPRRTTYFQCKAQKMPPLEIRREMRPGDVARPIFEELAAKRGAYILFSTDDVAHSGFESRMKAMREAVGDVAGAGNIRLDFLGADRIARWTNQHLGVALWLLEQTGRGAGGWRPAGQWSAPATGTLPYLLDWNRRATVGGRPLAVREAIVVMRGILAKPGGIVRLVGLSGMGKTRLAEALFDSRIHPRSALAPSRAIYGDVGLDLPVGAALLSEQLVLAEVEATIVADNCPARTHGQLAEIVGRPSSRSSLLTIDYDVGDDRLAGEHVVLDSNSQSVISDLLKQRCPKLTGTDRLHLSQFSGGNARIALKIAEGAEDGVNLAGLQDSELLERLFRSNRQEKEPGLRRSAELASLVYAFYVETADGHDAEHPSLAGIGDVTAETFYRHVATLLDWGIVQQRGPQRAVMPPPLANMLAAPYIRRSDPNSLLRRFVDGPPRLLASFARRLGELQGEPVAVRIARALLAPEGAFGQVAALGALPLRGFLGVAPAAPEAALAAIERGISGANGKNSAPMSAQARAACIRVLGHVALDEGLFRRAMKSMVELWAAGSGDEERAVAVPNFLTQFRPHAPRGRPGLPGRIEVIDELSDDPRPAVRTLAVDALETMLGVDGARLAWSHMFDDQARLHDAAPDPDRAAWVEDAYERLCRIAATEREDLRARAAAIICASLQHHAFGATGHAAVAAVRRVAPGGYWYDGWHAARIAFANHEARMDGAIRAEVMALEAEMQPRNIDQCFDAFVLREEHWHGFWTREIRRYSRPDRIAGLIGRRVGRRGLDLGRLLLRSEGASPRNNIKIFSKYVARYANSLDGLWNGARDAFVASARTPPQLNMLVGFLTEAGAIDAAWAEARLDEAAADPVLMEYLIALQTSRGFDETAVRRIIAVLASGRVRAEHFAELLGDKKIELVPVEALFDFLHLLYKDEKGRSYSISLLNTYLRDQLDSAMDPDRPLELARLILCDPRTYAGDMPGIGSDIAALARILLTARPNAATAAGICRAVRAARPSGLFVSPSFQGLGDVVRNRFPAVVLDEVLAEEGREDVVRVFIGRDRWVPEADALEWMLADTDARVPQLARIAPMESRQPGSGTTSWSPIAMEILKNAFNPAAVLRTFERRFFSDTDSLTFRLIRLRALVAALANHPDSRVRQWVRFAIPRIERHLARWGEGERGRDSRFE